MQPHGWEVSFPNSQLFCTTVLHFNDILLLNPCIKSDSTDSSSSASLLIRWETWCLLLTSIDRVNKEDTTNNFSSQIKNKMLSTFFEIIFYFYYWYFASSWNKISVSYWKWDSDIPILVQSKNKHRDSSVQTKPKEQNPSCEVTVAQQHNTLPMVYATWQFTTASDLRPSRQCTAVWQKCADVSSQPATHQCTLPDSSASVCKHLAMVPICREINQITPRHLTLSWHPCLAILNDLYSSSFFPEQNFISISIHSHVCYTSPHLIILTYLVGSTNYKAPHYAVFSKVLYFLPHSPVLSLAPCF